MIWGISTQSFACIVCNAEEECAKASNVFKTGLRTFPDGRTVRVGVCHPCAQRVKVNEYKDAVQVLVK